MLYAYQATGADEVTVQDGDDVAIVEPDGKFRMFLCLSSHTNY